MLKKLGDWLADIGLDSPGSASSGDEHSHPQSEAVQLAATALLLELGKADQHMDDDELADILAIAKTQFALDNHAATALLAQATRSSQAAISLYEFTEVLHRELSKQERFQLIVAMWQVAWSDGRIDRYEDHLIRKVADLIYVSHSDFIRAKHAAAPAG